MGVKSPIIPVLQRGPDRGIDVDSGEPRKFYDAIHNHVADSSPVDCFVIPARSGRAFRVRAGQVCRILLVDGPQVADFNCWNLHNSNERFWAARTRQIHGPYVTVYHRLWSCLPYLRPMLTVTDETIRYEIDKDGGGCHDLLGSRCDPYGHMLLTGEENEASCHTNLTKAIHPFGLKEEHVHDVINIFQVTGISRQDNKCFVKASPAHRGDYFEFFAEIDLLCAISACPQGDLSAPVTGPQARDLYNHCYPIGVEIFDVSPSLIADWRSPEPISYNGLAAYRSP